jgi:hypothetical protein
MSNSTLNLSCKIDAQKLFTAFMQVPLLAARELRTELKESLRVVQVDAKLHHEFKSHTHGLENAVQYEVKGDGLSGRLYLEQSRAPYAAAVHNGSKPHRIEPKTKKALHWVSGGTEFFSSKGVNHPGYKGDPFLFNSVKRQWPYIMARIRGATNRVFQMAGLK